MNTADPQGRSQPSVTSGSSIGSTMLQRIQAGDESAWSRVVPAFQPVILAWLRHWGASAADANDISQEVWIAVCRKVESFVRVDEDDTWVGWLNTVARRKWIDAQRRRDSTQLLGEHAERVPEAAEVATGEVTDEQRLALAALEMVRPDFHPQTVEIFWERAVEGLDYQDLATAHGVSIGAVRQAYSAVRKRCEQEFRALTGRTLKLFDEEED